MPEYLDEASSRMELSFEIQTDIINVEDISLGA
jgi:hypothetical protein